jgi:hypothetical protein
VMDPLTGETFTAYAPGEVHLAPVDGRPEVGEQKAL